MSAFMLAAVLGLRIHGGPLAALGSRAGLLLDDAPVLVPLVECGARVSQISKTLPCTEACLEAR